MILNFNRHKLFGILYAGWLYKHIARVFKILAHKLGVLKNFESRDDHQFKFFIFENEKNFVLDKINYNTLSVNIKS